MLYMSFFGLLPSYITWHYGRALRHIVRLTHTYLWFEGHFFSFKILLSTLFSPWQRIQEHNERKGDIQGLLSAIIVNTIMRLVGFFIRAAFLIIGSIAWIATLLLGVIVLAVWIALPLIIIGFFVQGIRLIAHNL